MLTVVPNEKQSSDSLVAEFRQHTKKSGIDMQKRNRYLEKSVSRNMRRQHATARRLNQARLAYKMQTGQMPKEN